MFLQILLSVCKIFIELLSLPFLIHVHLVLSPSTDIYSRAFLSGKCHRIINQFWFNETFGSHVVQVAAPRVPMRVDC